MYHYVCFDCCHEFEKEHSLRYYELVEEYVECPACESENIDDDE